MDLSVPVRVLSVSVTAITLVFVLAKKFSPVGGYSEFFAYHPALMAVAVLLILTQGTVAYIASYGERGNAKFPDRASRRALHGLVQLLACVMAGLGFLVVVADHAHSGESNIGKGVSKTLKAHIWFGYITLCFMFLQMCVGIMKFVIKTRDDKNVAHWHGTTGPIVYLLSIITLLLGFNGVAPKSKSGWKIVVSILACLTGILTVGFVLCGPAVIRAAAVRRSLHSERESML